MRRLFSCFVLLTLTALPVAADDKQPTPPTSTKADEELRALNKEYDNAVREFFRTRNDLAAKLRESDEAGRATIQKKLDEWVKAFPTTRPMTKFGPRFLEFAEQNAKGPTGVAALEVVLREEYRLSDISETLVDKNGLWKKAVQILQKKYVRSPDASRLMMLLAMSGEESAEQYLRSVMKGNPDRVTQARAAQALAKASERFADVATQLKQDPESRKKIEARYGKDRLEQAFAKGEKAKRDLKELTVLIREKYSDIIPDLSIGKKAPELIGQDIDGKKHKLSDLKGKVVVLDIWATWCVSCRAMIPDERKLVGDLKDKPFVLVSISVDEKKETLKQFLTKESMPWTHWWNGREGGIVDDWSITYFPTIYVIDAQGVIRYKDENGEFPSKKLEEAVNGLLKEIDKK